MNTTTFSVISKRFRDDKPMLIMQPALTSFSYTFRKCHICRTLVTFLELKMFISHGLMLLPSPHTKMLSEHPPQGIYQRHRDVHKASSSSVVKRLLLLGLFPFPFSQITRGFSSKTAFEETNSLDLRIKCV